MKKRMMICFGFIVLIISIYGNSILDEAKKVEKKDPEKAIEFMKEQIGKMPNNPDFLAYYGLLISQKAGRVNFLKAGYYVSKAFSLFGEALAIKPDHVDAKLYRGITSYYVPGFMGKAKQGIQDLQHLLKQRNLPNGVYVAAEYYLGLSYKKQNEYEKSRNHLQNVIRYGNKTEYYESAQDVLKTVDKAEIKPTSTYEQLKKEGMEAQENGDLHLAYKKYKQAFLIDHSDTMFLLNFAQLLGTIAENGYDETVYHNTNFLADLAIDVHAILSQAVKNAPNNGDIRVLRSTVAISLPFFVETQAAIEDDIRWMKEHNASQKYDKEIKKISTQLEKKIKIQTLADAYEEASELEKKNILNAMPQTDFEQAKPADASLKLVLELGYRDLIAPQTAIWIEDSEKNYLGTVYVSGFSGKVKEKQVHLVTWAKQSSFRNIDAVTGASIDAGKNTFYLSKNEIKKFAKHKNICICVEVAHWPNPAYSFKRFAYNLTDLKSVLFKGDTIIQELAIHSL